METLQELAVNTIRSKTGFSASKTGGVVGSLAQDLASFRGSPRSGLSRVLNRIDRPLSPALGGRRFTLARIITISAFVV
ncbi:unnamed protein product [Anisakis simplex]|uniref:ABC transporter ATP-binding protein n=1 Tax=Anisakis simplex TaxID=6269 RepID=A0A0M3K118_ANISI|nr:unnamed protein product [Anisakis simplex]